MIETINKLILNPLFSLLTGLIGFWLGNRLALGRDQRKEFNEIAESLHINLLRERDFINETNTPYTSAPDKMNFVSLRRHLYVWQFRSFDSALLKYYNAKSQSNYDQTGFGIQFYRNKELINMTIADLLKYTKRR